MSFRRTNLRNARTTWRAWLWIASSASFSVAEPDGQRANEPSLGSRLEALDRRVAETLDLTAHFEEEKFTPLLKKPLRSTGTVRVVQGRTRWDTESPHPVMMLLDGGELRLFFPQRQTLEVYALNHRVAQLALTPQPRLAELRTHFDVTAFDSPNPPDQERKFLRILLTPKTEELRKHIHSIRVWLDEEDMVVSRVELNGGDGERTVIRFRRVRRNTGLQPADLELQLPPDTVITKPLQDLTSSPAARPDQPSP